MKPPKKAKKKANQAHKAPQFQPSLLLLYIYTQYFRSPRADGLLLQTTGAPNRHPTSSQQRFVPTKYRVTELHQNLDNPISSTPPYPCVSAVDRYARIGSGGRRPHHGYLTLRLLPSAAAFNSDSVSASSLIHGTLGFSLSFSQSVFIH